MLSHSNGLNYYLYTNSPSQTSNLDFYSVLFKCSTDTSNSTNPTLNSLNNNILLPGLPAGSLTFIFDSSVIFTQKSNHVVLCILPLKIVCSVYFHFHCQHTIPNSTLFHLNSCTTSNPSFPMKEIFVLMQIWVLLHNGRYICFTYVLHHLECL